MLYCVQQFCMVYYHYYYKCWCLGWHYYAQNVAGPPNVRQLCMVIRAHIWAVLKVIVGLGLLFVFLPFCHCIVMAALWNRAGHYIFAMVFLFFIPRLISVAAGLMSTILLHMVWCQCEFRMQVCSQPNFAQCLAVPWAGTLYNFRRLLPHNGMLPGATFTLHPSLLFWLHYCTAL